MTWQSNESSQCKENVIRRNNFYGYDILFRKTKGRKGKIGKDPLFDYRYLPNGPNVQKKVFIKGKKGLSSSLPIHFHISLTQFSRSGIPEYSNVTQFVQLLTYVGLGPWLLSYWLPSARNSACPIFVSFPSKMQLRYPVIMRSRRSDVDIPGVRRVGMNLPGFRKKKKRFIIRTSEWGWWIISYLDSLHTSTHHCALH